MIVVEFTTNTNVDLYAAKNAELDMKAHFLAKSGMNLGELVIRLQGRIDNGINKQGGYDIQLGDFVDQIIGAFGGSKEERDAWAELVGGISADDIEGLGVPEGEFSLQITTEDKKINLNCANGTPSQKKSLWFQLYNLFLLRSLQPDLRERGPPRAGAATARLRSRRSSTTSTRTATASTRRDTPPARIGEDYGYETLRDKYKPKNNYLDTADEIKLARGVDDRLWDALWQLVYRVRRLPAQLGNGGRHQPDRFAHRLRCQGGQRVGGQRSDQTMGAGAESKRG